MRKLLMFVIAILLAVGGASAAVNFTSFSPQIAYQVSDFVVSSNDSYIGAIKISNINLADYNYDGIVTVTITADTYSMTVSSKRSIFWSSLNSTFYDYSTGTNESHSWTELAPGLNDSLYVPWVYYGDIISDASIIKDRIYWIIDDQIWGSKKSLLNAPFNESQIMVRRVMPSKYVHVVVTGTKQTMGNPSRVDVTYLIGTLPELNKATRDTIQLGNETDDLNLIRHIPFIGSTLVDSSTFLIEFISLIFLLLFYTVTNIDIIVLMQLDFCMLHGIMRMASGGTPYDGISTLVRDFNNLMKLMFYVFVQTFKLLWIIAIAMINAAGKAADLVSQALSWITNILLYKKL